MLPPNTINMDRPMAHDTVALIRLAQWLSPAFPVGGYAYSHGLEHTISVGEVCDRLTFAAWLHDILKFGAGWNDAVLLACTLRGGDPTVVADHARALCAGRERWQETIAQGRAFMRTVNALDGGTDTDLPLPVAVGMKARDLGLRGDQVIGQYLHAFAGNLTTIATRAVPLGQTEAQAVLAGLVPMLAEMAEAASTAGLDDLTSGAMRADLHALCHETQEVRLYLT